MSGFFLKDIQFLIKMRLEIKFHGIFQRRRLIYLIFFFRQIEGFKVFEHFNKRLQYKLKYITNKKKAPIKNKVDITVIDMFTHTLVFVLLYSARYFKFQKRKKKNENTSGEYSYFSFIKSIL